MHSNENATFQYDLTVITGIWKNSGTDANVAIVIHGTAAQSQPIILNKNMIKSRTVLARGNEDSFTINLPMSLGDVRFIHVWHDNSGKNPSWFLSHVIVMDHQTEDKWHFPCDSWLAVEKGDGKIDRILLPVSPREMKSFKYSLKSQQSKSFSDGHLWLSVVTKSPASRFTRVQRATCCLSVLMASMLVNAMFYRTDKLPDPTIQVGPLRFSWRQLMIGLQSALIVTPINFLIMALFRRRRKPPSTRVDAANTESTSSLESENSPSASSCKKGEGSITSRPSIKEEAQEKKASKCPSISECIAWFLCFMVVLVSAVITFYYSLQWGKVIANQWLSSMFISFTEDLFVLQPTKILLVVILSACLCHSDDPEVVRHEEGKGKTPSSSEKGSSDSQSTRTASAEDLQNIVVSIPEEEELDRARDYRRKETKAFSFGRQMAGFLFFLFLLMVVCYGNRSQHGFLIGKTLRDTLSDFPGVSAKRRLRWISSLHVQLSIFKLLGCFHTMCSCIDESYSIQYMKDICSLSLRMP